MKTHVKPHLSAFVSPDAHGYRVNYQPYNVHWDEAYDDVANIVRGAVGPVRIEHVGSTAVAGLGGRGALDVAVVLPARSHARARRALIASGFEPSPFEHYLPLLVACVVNAHGTFPVLLYLVDPNADVLREWLVLRNYLRSHPGAAAAYDAAKQKATLAGDGDAYQRAKTPCIEALREQAGGTGSSADQST